MKLKFCSAFSIFALLSSLAGCSSAPSLSRGGLAEHHIELLDPYYENTPISKDNAILFEFELLRQQIAGLVLEGAKLCFPATVLELHSLEKRVARQIAGNMMFDATNDIIVLRHLTHRLERRLDYVLTHEICVPPQTEQVDDVAHTIPPDIETANEATESGLQGSVSESNVSSLDSEVTSVTMGQADQDDTLANVLRWLNADNQFAVNSSAVNLKYVGRLAVAAEVLMSLPDIHLTITGYADIHGTEMSNEILGTQRAQNVLRYLHAFGIPKERMQILSKGEKEPLFDGTDAHILLTNRRVEIALVATAKKKSE